MSQPASLLVVSQDGRPSFVDAVAQQNARAIVDTSWTDAKKTFEDCAPAAVIVVISEGCDGALTSLAKIASVTKPYVPLIGIGSSAEWPDNLLSCVASTEGHELGLRLSAALRVRTLHATVLRRANDLGAPIPLSLEPTDLLSDATALLLGRGPSYPGLSVAVGQHMELVGALSIEAAARHLNIRDIDGVFIGEGFSTRVIDAFLTVLSEDVRFRNLPVIMTGRLAGAVEQHGLANLEVLSGEPAAIVARSLPLIRQHAFEIRLSRALKTIDSNGLLDARTGLMTAESFDRDFAQTVADTLSRGGHLSAAQFAFDTSRGRACIDAARIVSRLMRKMDFAALQDDGSIITAFAETDLRAAHVIARRLASILQSTLLGGDSQSQLNPRVTLATLKANDSAEAIRGRLTNMDQPAPADLRTGFRAR